MTHASQVTHPDTGQVRVRSRPDGAGSPHDPFGDGFLLDHQHPDLRRVSPGDWLPALRAGVAEEKAELEEIAARGAPADVDDPLRAVGRAGGRLRRVQRAFSCVFSADAGPDLQDVQAHWAPEMAAHRDWVQLHPGLHHRLRELAQRIDAGAVSPTAEQRRMLHRLLAEAEAAGAGLSGTDQERLRELNRQIAAEETAYQRLQRAEAAESAVYVASADELVGFDDAVLSSAREAARAAGHDAGHLLRLGMPVQQPALAVLHDRQTRRRLHLASSERGGMPGDDGRTTRQIGADIAVLRARRARLLGHDHHLDAVLPLRTASDVSAVEDMLGPLIAGARRRLAEELAVVEEHLRAAGDVHDELRPWDLTYGIAAVERAARGAAEGRDDAPGPPADASLPLEEALGRVFAAARRVYGLQVHERTDLPGFVDGARSFEVRDVDGAVLGLFLLDPFARPTKAGGAWMNSFSVASSLTGSRPVVINCLNLARPADGEAAQVTRAEQKTLFHEFGHALHGLLAEAEFEALSGTAVPRDAVEFPSQVNEVFADLWRPSPASGSHLHPGADPHWGRGASMVEHLAAVVLDLAWHTLSPEQAEEAARDPEGFEDQALAAWGLDHPLVPPRYGTGCFKHIFAGSGYAAGYYSYLWAQVLAADAAEWFRTVMDDESALRKAGDRFRAELLRRGDTRELEESFRHAIGREPTLAPLLRSLGMTPPA